MFLRISLGTALLSVCLSKLSYPHHCDPKYPSTIQVIFIRSAHSRQALALLNMFLWMFCLGILFLDQELGCFYLNFSKLCSSNGLLIPTLLQLVLFLLSILMISWVCFFCFCINSWVYRLETAKVQLFRGWWKWCDQNTMPKSWIKLHLHKEFPLMQDQSICWSCFQ